MKVFLTTAILLMGIFGYSKTIELNTKNAVIIRNEISDTSVSKAQLDLAKKVTERGTKGYTLYLVLDSPGGDISAGLNFIEFAKTIPNLETVTLFSASMASAIVEQLPGKRNIIETGILMFHRAAGGVNGQFESGELESRLGFYKKLVREMEQVNADRMSLSLDTYKSKVKDELWILGKDAVQSKAADEIVNISCSSDLLNTSAAEQFTVMGMFTIGVKFNGCPLIKAGEVLQPEMRAQYKAYRETKWRIGSSK